MLKEHERAVLTQDLPAEGLQAGDVGVVVHVYPGHKAYALEFFALDGSTIAVTTVEAGYLRPVTDKDVSHARALGMPHLRDNATGETS